VTEETTPSADQVERTQVSAEKESVPHRELSLVESEPVATEIDCSVNLSSRMTEKESEGPAGQQHVPDVQSALQDPLCTSPCLFLGSPVKSESSESQKSCEAWSDLIEQDERESKDYLVEEGLVSELSLSRAACRHDSGVASPTEEFHTPKEETKTITASGERPAQRKARLNSGEDAGIGGSDHGDNISDSGQGSDSSLEDTQLLTYHFHIQDYLCGKLIGKSGIHINKLKAVTNCNILLKDLTDTKIQQLQKKIRLKPRDKLFGEGLLNLCIIEGTRTNIDKCLDLIKEKFIQNPELSLEQINKPENTPLSLYNGSVTLSLAEGIMHDVFVSSVVSGGHIFIQQPAHPTFSALERLDSCMYNTYSQLNCPDLGRPVLVNTICGGQ